jgi:hypothetical protein
VQVDFAVELGRDDELLEFPWDDPAGVQQYFDLKRRPELIAGVREAAEHQELREFLASVNSASSMLETAKCDVWCSTQMNIEDDIFGASSKFGSYVDLLFSNTDLRFSLESHEKMARDLTELLKKSPDIPASAEFLIRRCYYHVENQEPSFGFYVSFYLFGYGEGEEESRKRWAIALKLVENAIRQISARTSA